MIYRRRHLKYGPGVSLKYFCFRFLEFHIGKGVGALSMAGVFSWFSFHRITRIQIMKNESFFRIINIRIYKFMFWHLTCVISVLQVQNLLIVHIVTRNSEHLHTEKAIWVLILKALTHWSVVVADLCGGLNLILH